MQHKLMHLSNVIFQGKNAKHFGAGFQMEDRITPGHWCVKQLVLMQRCKFMENMVGMVKDQLYISPQTHSQLCCIMLARSETFKLKLNTLSLRTI